MLYELGAGPMRADCGLQSLLETRLGLTRPLATHAARVNAYRKALETVDFPDSYYHISFQADPIHTADYLLNLRDTLVSAGWAGQPGPDNTLENRLSRLKALATAELEFKKFRDHAGSADQLLAVRNRLASWPRRIKLPIAEIPVLEERDLLPPIWREIFQLLASTGIPIAYDAEPGLSGTAEANNAPSSQVLRIHSKDPWPAADCLACHSHPAPLQKRRTF